MSEKETKRNVAKSPLKRCLRCKAFYRGVCCAPDWARYQADKSPLYKTTRWKRTREHQLALEPLCSDCSKPATDVHHVIKHNGDPEIFWSSPLMSLCHSCHSIRTRLGQ